MPKRKMNERVSCNIKVIVRLTLLSLWETRVKLRRASGRRSLHTRSPHTSLLPMSSTFLHQGSACPRGDSVLHTPVADTKGYGSFFLFPIDPLVKGFHTWSKTNDVCETRTLPEEPLTTALQHGCVRGTGLLH